MTPSVVIGRLNFFSNARSRPADTAGAATPSRRDSMTRSAWAWVGVALLALGGLYAADDKEPAYNGKPLSAWAAQLKDKDAAARLNAANALAALGPAARPAIPALV